MRLTILQLIKLRLEGYVYVGDQIRVGWKNPIPFYAFRCPIHGIVVDWARGYDERLECPKCKKELNLE